MTNKKKRGRPAVEDKQETGSYIKFSEDDLQEGKNAAKSEGYTFSGWVKMLIKKEIKRIKRRKK